MLDFAGKAASKQDDDIDAILAEVDKSAPAQAIDSEPSASAAPPPAEAPVDSLTTVEAVNEAMNAPGCSKTRKQKLKQRLKTLQVPCCVLLQHALPPHASPSCASFATATCMLRYRMVLCPLRL